MACGHLNAKKIKSAHSTEYGEPVPIEYQLFPNPKHPPQQMLQQTDGFDVAFPPIELNVQSEHKLPFKPSSDGADDENEPLESLDTESDVVVPKHLDTDIISENVTESSGTKSPPSLRKKKKKSKSSKRD